MAKNKITYASFLKTCYAAPVQMYLGLKKPTEKFLKQRSKKMKNDIERYKDEIKFRKRWIRDSKAELKELKKQRKE